MDEGVKDNLHSYMAGIFKNVDNPALFINSVPDHVHALFRLSKNAPLAKIVEEVKKGSSKWMKDEIGNRSFYWQTGYAAFSVSSSKVNSVKRYIARQEDHHKQMNCRGEIERFMKQYDVVEYNSEYFWE
ncbi:MAG: transposase [Balneolaceae bacterium]|nr:transposase [Balneolaceae bacterium]